MMHGQNNIKAAVGIRKARSDACSAQIHIIL